MSFGVTALGMMCAAQAASATDFAFNFTNKGTYEASTAGNVTGAAAVPQTFSSTSDGSTLNVKVTAWHANDPNSNAVTTDSISAARLGYWSGAGMGVLFGNDTGSNGTHQIDNVGGGVDFVMLQFDQDVTLTGMGRNVYSMAAAGVSCCSSRAQYWADPSDFLGQPSSTVGIPLQNYLIDESTFKNIDSQGQFNAGTTAASVWLISAAFNQTTDGFKISSLGAKTVSAVPEPATWAMMMIGFGAIGCGLRRRKTTTAALA
jgi:hypothetical protein